MHCQATDVPVVKLRAMPRLLRGWAEGLTFSPEEPKDPPKRRRKDDVPIVVTSDWVEQIPITDLELRIIEGYLRHELDELFGPLP